jgi:hypothetical protein
MNSGVQPADPGFGPATLTLSFRPGLRRTLETYTLTPHQLTGPHLVIDLADIASIRLYSVPGMTALIGPVAFPQRFCVVKTRSGMTLRLHSNFPAEAPPTGRAAEFLCFIDSLVRHVRALDPASNIWLGMPPLLFWSWSVTFGLLDLALLLVIVFGSIGLAQQQQFTWGIAGFMLVLVAIGTPPFLFLRATWRRRSQPAGADLDRLWQRADRA